MAEALTQVKSAMGSDAIILHTRTLQTRAWMGLRRKELVEITAGKDLKIGPRPGRGRVSAAAGSNGNGGAAKEGRAALPSGAYSRNGNGAVMPAAPRNAVEGSRQVMETPGATNAAMLTISQEMSALRSMVKDLVTSTRLQHKPQVPEDLFEYYMQLIQSQVADELATEIVRSLQKQLRPEHLAQPQFIRDKIAEHLEKLVPTSGPIRRTKPKEAGPHVVALIGPTGVGKTTTIAKLAAHLKLREKHRVGLITLDTYRIAAVDQLKRYAEIIGSPLRVVSNAEQLREAMSAMSDCDFIMIDTAGRSPNDALKLNELRNLLDAANPDEVHLVLSSTASQECVELAVQKFGDVRVDKIIFTKIDEAAHVGAVLNVVRKVNKSLSYITTGQDVPDDIEVGRGKRLAQLIMGMTL
jgi:flagellar biosynthesis protein FlhF